MMILHANLAAPESAPMNHCTALSTPTRCKMFRKRLDRTRPVISFHPKPAIGLHSILLCHMASILLALSCVVLMSSHFLEF
ncbi:hypothetical protein BJ508DRAFT_52851 [Ascobolus immersus RN42]|uniref:Uncharacterized protein n=1 Tax=Ascobolus immersus RN42 TaxID=1160509 RepID=A0A3N4HLE2_ASCIM|nr:hypothetical protein BJ508DRAFT_52851 [Ascobolus immersus RN42]